MRIEEVTARVLDVLNELEIPYMLVGAFSVNFHGLVRSTHDADFVAVFSRPQIAAIVQKLGEDFRLDPQMSFESATGTTRYIVNYLDPSRKSLQVEFFRLSDDEFDQQRFARKIQGNFLGRPVYLLTAEDVIVTKLRWYKALNRSKDKDDARGVIAVQGDRLDWDYIRRWCHLHDTRELLEAVRASIPPM
ncbi:MAG: hypothetical protein ACLP9L_36670 [Thermoguttaceae bacterium]